MYPDCRVLFGSGVPVPVSGGYSREARKILWRHGLRCASHWSSCLLKELSQPFGRDDEIDHRFSRDITPGVLCAGRHVDVIACFSFNPLVALFLCATPQIIDRGIREKNLQRKESNTEHLNSRNASLIMPSPNLSICQVHIFKKASGQVWNMRFLCK
jgi:hypothetical protein